MLNAKQTFDVSYGKAIENNDYESALTAISDLKETIEKLRDNDRRQDISRCELGSIPFWHFSMEDLKAKCGMEFDTDVPVNDIRNRFRKYFEDYQKFDDAGADYRSVIDFYQKMREPDTAPVRSDVKFEIIYVDSETTACYDGQPAQTDCPFTPLICHFHVGNKIYKIINKGFWEMDYLTDRGYMSPPFDNNYDRHLEGRKDDISGESTINPLELFKWVYFNRQNVPKTEVMEMEYSSNDDSYQHYVTGTMYYVSGTVQNGFVFENMSENMCDETYPRSLEYIKRQQGEISDDEDSE